MSIEYDNSFLALTIVAEQEFTHAERRSLATPFSQTCRNAPELWRYCPHSVKLKPMSAANPAIIVRALRAEDRQNWAVMWHDYLAFYETAVPDAVYDSTFSRLLGDDPQDFSCLIAERDGVPQGLVHFLFHRHAWKVENVCYLQDLFATPDSRGTGVGRALIEAVYQPADRAGAPSVYWLTQDFNETARKLYDRVGVLTPFIRYNRPS